ncbi:MAG: tyrosine-protein phosphatase [Atopobiaceae bacterium]|nr:tyrosine-protein phosphatase [Atopobiaceae bacterium]
MSLQLPAPVCLNFEGSHNVRDLGGYPCPSGVTKHGRYMRSGSVSELDSDGQSTLRNYGVNRVLDLRSEGELLFEPNPFSNNDKSGVEFRNLALSSYNMSDPALDRGNDDGLISFVTSGYFSMLSYKYGVRGCFSFLSKADKDGCTLFHCAAGKDRTGVLSMLVLALAGVSKEHIICDYCYSFGSVDEVNALVLEGADIGERQSKLALRRDAMALVYSRLLEVHGSIGSYLLSCGVNYDMMDKVCEQLLG